MVYDINIYTYYIHTDKLRSLLLIFRHILNISALINSPRKTRRCLPDD